MANARSFLVPFLYSHKVAYVIEFSHEKIRLFAKGKQVKSLVLSNMGDGGDLIVEDDGSSENVVTDGENTELENTSSTAYEIASPYTLADLWDEDGLCFKLQTIQHSDVLYIFSENHPIKVLKRYSNREWKLEDLELKNGPFMAMNSTDTIMTAVAGDNGTASLTTSKDVFAATDVGRLVRLRAYAQTDKIWASNVTVTAGDIFLSDNKYYQAVNGGTTGSKKPTHTDGIRSDGSVRWKYAHDGSGIVKITAVTSARAATAKVLAGLPAATADGTVYWELGLLHGGDKYPRSGAFFRNRFAFLVNSVNGPQVCLSVSGDYNNFADMEAGEQVAESAITVPVLSTEYNEGQWLFAGDVLFVGTGSAEFFIDQTNTSSALSNDNIKISQISNVGSKAIKPVKVGAHIFFVDRFGLSLRDLSYNYYNDGYDQVDISILGKHLFSSRIVAMAYQEVPDKLLWCLTGDGNAVALTFSAEQEVAALSRHDFSGAAESLAIVPDFESNSDVLWLEIKRMINKKSLRTVEMAELGMPLAWPDSVSHAHDLAERSELERAYVLNSAFYLDGAVLFERERNDTRVEMDGLDHLEGEVVSVFADGAVCDKQVVINGKISIKPSMKRVLVGKEIVSRYIPQSFYLADENGSGIGEPERINHLSLMLYHSGGGAVGEDEEHLSDILYRPTDGVLDKPHPLFSGVKELLFNGSTSKNAASAEILIENRSPLPMNILAIIPSF